MDEDVRVELYTHQKQHYEAQTFPDMFENGTPGPLTSGKEQGCSHCSWQFPCVSMCGCVLVCVQVCEGEWQRDGEEMTGEGVEPLVSSCTSLLMVIHASINCPPSQPVLCSGRNLSVHWFVCVHVYVCICKRVIPHSSAVGDPGSFCLVSWFICRSGTWSNHLFYWAPGSNYVSCGRKNQEGHIVGYWRVASGRIEARLWT